MNTTLVEIAADGDYREAKPNEVLIVAGESIQFASPAGFATTLSVCKTAAAILLPKPESLQVEIPAGTSITFTWGAPADGPYCAQVLAAGTAVPALICDNAEGGPILRILSSGGRDLKPPVDRLAPPPPQTANTLD